MGSSNSIQNPGGAKNRPLTAPAIVNGSGLSPAPTTTAANLGSAETPIPNQPQQSPMDRTVATISNGNHNTFHKSTASLSRLFRGRKKWRPKRRGSISASFNVNESEIQVELMNVNTASEDELMTLSGVSRTLARNIVNHRQIIGAYRIVEDLALVSGMGATKLDAIRPEICVSKRKNLSRASSNTTSMDSIPSSEFGRVVVSRPIRVLNVNTATIFDLMTIHGINQALAARIITYRDRKGPYKTLDDLRNVRISPNRLGAIRAYLATEDMEFEKSSTPTRSQPTPSRTLSQTSSRKGLRMSSSIPVIKSDPNSTTTTTDALDKIATGFRGLDDMKVIYELLSIKSNRPRRESEFRFEHNSQPAYRIATWNLESMTAEKIANPGVMEVITRTILENGLSIIAVQEICDKGALEKICGELNDPRLSRIREWSQTRGKWKYILEGSPVHYDKKAHHLGILYNAEQIDEILIPDSSTVFTPFQNGSLWQFGIFTVKMKNSKWLLVNVWSSSPSGGANYTNGHTKTGDSQPITTLMQTLLKDLDGAVVIGHFNPQQAKKGLGNMDELEEIPPMPENLEDGDQNNDGVPMPAKSSLWVTKGLKGFMSGESGLINEGLTHLAIPNGWGWGGRVTESAPHWCTLYCSPKGNNDI